MQTANRTIRKAWRYSIPLLPWGLCVACAGLDAPKFKPDADATSVEALTISHSASFQDGADQYTGTSDTYIVENHPTANNATAPVLYVSDDEQRRTGRDMSALLRFDVSGIPNDAVVTAATLTLYVADPSVHPAPIFGLNRAWGESTSNWLRAATGIPWQSPGASGSLDRDATPLGVIDAHSNGTTSVTLNANGLTELQHWIQDPTSNFGFVIAAPAGKGKFGFYSSEFALVSRRPRLSITYAVTTADCLAPTCCSSDLACDDANPCTANTCTAGACNSVPIAGCCNSASDCPDDGNPCTTNFCDNHLCSQQTNAGCCMADGDCGDDNACTADNCVANVCLHAAVSGCCLSDAECNDGNVCTADACVGNACASAAIAGCCLSDAECNDGSACTIDACVTNACQHGAVPGCCLSNAECDDGNACTADSCVETLCAHVPVFGGTCGCVTSADCNDGDPCTLDACVDERCSNSAANCSDANPATVDVCVDGYCHHTGPIATTKTFRKGQNSYQSMTDTRIVQNSPAVNYDAETTIMVDGDEPSGGGNDVYALLKWEDLGIPSGAMVTGASITAYIGGDTSAASVSAYPIYAMRRPWTASQATWQQADATSIWNSSGVLGELDRGIESIASTPISTAGSALIALNAAGIAEVQSWVTDPTQNYGIVAASPSNTDGLVFYSSEFANVWYRPMLSVTYTTEQTLVDPEPVVGGGSANPGPKYGFFVYSDSHVEAATNSGFQSALDQMTALKNADGAPPIIAAISLGDHTEDGKTPSWDWHLGITRAYWDEAATSFDAARPRYIAVPGNHDVMDSANWYNNWTTHLPGLVSLGGTSSSAAGVYYSFTAQNALFVGVDTNTATNTATAYTSDPQIQMLRSALTASSAPFKFVFYHKPAFYCGNGGLGPNASSVAFVDLAAQNNVDVVFNGHSHVYSRTCRMTKEHVCTDSASGTVQVEVGTVGATDARLRALKTTSMSVTGYDASGVKSTLSYTCSSAGGYAATLGSKRTFCYVNVQGCVATVNCYQVGNTEPFDTWTIDHCH